MLADEAASGDAIEPFRCFEVQEKSVKESLAFVTCSTNYASLHGVSLLLQVLARSLSANPALLTTSLLTK
jgi:hypothetical protein